MGLIKKDLKWIIDLSNELSVDNLVLDKTLNELKKHSKDVYCKRSIKLNNEYLNFFNICMKSLFSSKWFVLLDNANFKDIVCAKINSTMNAYFVKEKSGDISLVLFEVKKGSKTFYLKDDNIFVFENNNDFFICYEKEKKHLEKHYFSINNKMNKMFYSREYDDHFMIYFFNKKFKVIKDAKKFETLAYEYDYFGNEKGLLLLTSERFIEYSKDNIQDFLIFENYIYIKYKEGSSESIIDIDLKKRYFLNPNETNYIFCREIDKKNINDELELWELNYRY